MFVDANVWFTRTLRDWIGLLSTVDELPPFEVRWTEDVLAELLYHLRRLHPEWDGKRTSGIRDILTEVFEDGRVSDFTIDESYQGPDPLDAHVHAATLASRADFLVTSNVKDFVWDENESSYEVLHPDDFLVMIDDIAPESVALAVIANCTYWIKRAGEADLPARLRSVECPKFAERVRRHLQGPAGAVVYAG